MSEATPPAIDAGRLDKDICQEVLNEAQALVKTQLDSGESLNTKLSGLLSQATTLAIAAFGAAALAFSGSTTAPAWMPGWGAAGFLAAGIFWVRTALKAADALKPIEWQAGFSPRRLWTPKILNAPSAAEGLLYIASQTQGMIDANDKINTRLAGKLSDAQADFTRALPVGLGIALLGLLVSLLIRPHR